MNIKKPKEPTKPSKPKEPTKTFTIPYSVHIDDDCDLTIEDFFKKNRLEEVPLSKIMIKSYIEGGYDYMSPTYRVVEFYYMKECENVCFDSDMKTYKKRLKNYEKKMEEYIPKYEKYKKELEVWKSQQKKKDKKNLEKEKEKLEKKLEKLKKEIANEQ